MREHEVLTSQVQVEAGSQQFHPHGAALDMPSGPSFAPRTRPKYFPVFGHPRFPESEIRDGFLGILITLHAFADAHLFKIQLHQLAVLMTRRSIFFDAEIDR